MTRRFDGRVAVVCGARGPFAQRVDPGLAQCPEHRRPLEGRTGVLARPGASSQ